MLYLDLTVSFQVVRLKAIHCCFNIHMEQIKRNGVGGSGRQASEPENKQSDCAEIESAGVSALAALGRHAQTAETRRAGANLLKVKSCR
jgi:hypothetical protein